MNFLLLAAAIPLIAGAGAQYQTGFTRIVGGPGLDRGVDVSPTKDGGFIAVGATESFGEGGEDVYLVRTDSTGKVLWTKTYGGTAPDFGWSVQEVPGGFAVGGFTESFGAGGFDCYLVKTDADGETQWSKTFGGEGKDRCWALTSSDDGGYVLVGETTSSGAGKATGRSNSLS